MRWILASYVLFVIGLRVYFRYHKVIPEQRVIRAPGAGLCFDTNQWGHPDNPDAIVMHGGWVSGTANKQNQIACRRLAQRHPDKRVIYVSPPGVGKTSWYTRFALRRRILKVGFNFVAQPELEALKADGVRRIWFVGSSMGANICAKLALMAPVYEIEVIGFVSNSGVLRRYANWRDLQKVFANKESVREHQAIRTSSPDPEVRAATETRLRLAWEVFRDMVGRCLILKPSKALMMITYGQLLARGELMVDLRRLSRRGVPIHLIVGRKDVLSDRATHLSFWSRLQRERSDAAAPPLGPMVIVEDPTENHGSMTSDPSVYVHQVSTGIRHYTK